MVFCLLVTLSNLSLPSRRLTSFLALLGYAVCANRTTAGFAGPKQPPLCSPRGGSQCSPAQAARYWRYVDAFAQADRMPPWNDTVLANSIMAFTTAKPNGAGRSAQVGQALQHVLIPDELSADLGSSGHAGYLGVETKTGNFGGRGPSTDVINPSLGAIFGDTVSKLGLAPDDHAETPCLTNDNLQPDDRGVTSSFPYLGTVI